MDSPLFRDMDDSEIQEEDQPSQSSRSFFDEDDDNITGLQASPEQEEAEISAMFNTERSFSGEQDISGGLLHTGVDGFPSIYDTREPLMGLSPTYENGVYPDIEVFPGRSIGVSPPFIPNDIISELYLDSPGLSRGLEGFTQQGKLFIITATILTFLDIPEQKLVDNSKDDSCSDTYSGYSSNDTSMPDIQEPDNRFHISPPSSPSSKPLEYHQHEGEDLKEGGGGDEDEEAKRRRIPFPPNEGEAIINLYYYYTGGKEYRKIIDIARRIHLDLYMDPNPSADIQELRTQLGITVGSNSAPIRSVISVRDHLYNYRKLNNLVRRHKKKRRGH